MQTRVHRVLKILQNISGCNGLKRAKSLFTKNTDSKCGKSRQRHSDVSGRSYTNSFVKKILINQSWHLRWLLKQSASIDLWCLSYTPVSSWARSYNVNINLIHASTQSYKHDIVSSLNSYDAGDRIFQHLGSTPCLLMPSTSAGMVLAV